MRRTTNPDQNVRYDWEGQEPDEEIEITLAPARLPRVTVKTNGVTTRKTCTIVQLLGLLDNSTTVAALSLEESRVASVPALPDRTLLVDVVQYEADNEHVVTGWIPAGEHPFLLVGSGGEALYSIPLPTLVYRARWSERDGRLDELSLTLAPGFPETGSVPDKLAAPLYRYPFSNVYSRFGRTLEGVCWPTMHGNVMALHEVPQRGVRAFLSVPNNHDLYGRGLSHAAPHDDYADLLAAVEEGGVPTSWLLPAEMTPADLHVQKRNTNQEEKIA